MTRSAREIDDEARRLALAAAERSGLSLAELAEALTPAPVRPPTRPTGRSAAAAEPSDLRAISDAVARLTAERDSPARSAAAAPAPVASRRLDDLLEVLDVLDRRLQSLAVPGEPAAAEIARGEAARDQIARADAAQAEISRAEIARAEAAQAEIARVEAARVEAAAPVEVRAPNAASSANRPPQRSELLLRAIAEIDARRSALRDGEGVLPEPSAAGRLPPSVEPRSTLPPPAPSRAGLSAPEPRQAMPPVARPESAEPRPAAAERPTSDIERHFRALAERIDNLALPRLETTVADLTGEIRRFGSALESRDRNGPTGEDIAEIRALGARVDELLRRQPDRALIDPLVLEIARLREAVLQPNLEGSLRSLENGYGHIVERLDDLGRGVARHDLVAQVAGDISALRDTLRTLPGVADVGRLERGIAAVAVRLEAVARDSAAPDTAGIESDLADIRRALSAYDPSRLVEVFDQRLSVVSERIEGLERVARGGVGRERMAAYVEELKAAAAGERIVGGIGALERRLGEVADRLAAIEAKATDDRTAALIADRLGAIADAVDRVDIGMAGRDDLDRLRADVADLAGRLETTVGARAAAIDVAPIEAGLKRIEAQLAERSPTAQLGVMQAFETRVTRIVEKLDRFEPRQAQSELPLVAREIGDLRKELARALAARDDDALSRRIDGLARVIETSTAGAGRAADAAAVAAMAREIGDLREEVLRRDDGLVAARIDALARTIGNAAPPVDDRALVSIEEHLDRIARGMETSESRFEGLGAIEDTIAQMHLLLADRRGETVAAAREAARQAVQDFAHLAEDHGSAVAIDALRQEMRELQIGTRTHEAAAIDTLRSVHDALSAVIGRLQAIEQREMPSAFAAPPRQPERPRDVAEDTRPLEPGSGNPNGQRPGRAAGEAKQRPAAAEEGQGPSRKADFIAAARRAAQAAHAIQATAPAEEPVQSAVPDDQGQTASDRRGPLAKIGAALRGRGRPLMLAAAAVLLAAFALQLVSGHRAGDSELAEAGATATRTAAATPPARREPVAPARQIDRPPVAAGLVETALAPPSGLATTFGDAARPPATAGFVRDPSPPAAAPAATPARAEPAEVADPLATGGIQRPPPVPGLLPDKIGSSGLKAAAAAGDAKAQFEIGLRFAEGRGIAADMKEAAAWYARAADQGFAPAQYRLGSAYEKGYNGARDVGAAKRWYLAGAERGNVRAMHNLGVLYANERDMANAVPWFQKAAEFGVKDSQFNLGIIHALGSGVKQDLAVAYKWFALAAAQGDKDAEKKRDDVTGHLDKTLLASARMAVQTFRPKPVDAAANDEAAIWIEPAGSAPTTAAVGGEAISRTQTLLQARGAYAGPINGELTPQTRQAIRTYQRKLGLKATGEPDEALLQALQAKTI